MIILVINCGSSSIKYQLLDMKSDDVYDVMAKGNVEKIGLPDGPSDHKEGMKIVLNSLVDPKTGVLKSFDDIEAVGHRIVQGADFFGGSALVNEDVIKKIEICCDFAPLHNPAHLLGIHAVSEVLPSVPQVVTFDTAFHQTMPEYAYMYALPYEYYTKYRVRRYGAHGTSHQYVSLKGAKLAGIDINHSKIITCHIGNGSSVTAILDGKCIDTTMGFTPLEGMIMGTRCGNIDANIIPYIQKKEGLTPDQTTTMMNKESGLMALSGVSSDLRDLDAAATEGNPRAKLALKKLTYDLTKNIGAMAAALNGVDMIIFTAGIGEHNPRMRRRVCENLAYMGVKLDPEANTASGEEKILSSKDSKVVVALIPTNEELVIARDTMHIVSTIEE